jgi:ElaB/YqjD/DUF883 family membrane-anchored ribosome-binding protein
MSEFHTASPGGDGRSQSMVAQAQEKVQETAQQASSTAGRYVREQVETRAVQAGAELQAIAHALQRSGHSLHADGNDVSARAVETVTERVHGVATYLGGTSGDRMLHDVESFGRRRPWAMIGAGVALGFAASRFLKASSRNRYETARRPGGYPAYGVGAPAAAPLAPPPAVPPPAVPTPAAQTIGGAPVTGR